MQSTETGDQGNPTGQDKRTPKPGTGTTLDRLDLAFCGLRKAAARLHAGDSTAIGEADRALAVVRGIVVELQVVASDPGHGGPLSGSAGGEFVMDAGALG